jgi:hypothetical protein
VKQVAVLAHFMSANLGDRYQGVGLLFRLRARFGEGAVVAVNSHTDLTFARGWQFKDTRYEFKVLNPRNISWSDYDLVLAPTGSLNANTQFLDRFRELVEVRNPPGIVVWGGFSNIYSEEGLAEDAVQSMRPLLQSKKVHFVARSELERHLFRRIVSGRRPAVLGGDPILLNERQQAGSHALVKEPVPFVINGQVASTPTELLFSRIAAVASAIISVDPVEDATFLQRHSLRGGLILNDLHDFAASASTWSTLVTTRLHAGVLAKFFNPRCRVVFVPFDLSANLSGSAKYFAVTTSSIGLFRHIGRLSSNPTPGVFVPASDSEHEPEIRAHNQNFRKYVSMAERTFDRIVDRIVG